MTQQTSNNLICGLCMESFDANEPAYYAKNMGNMTASMQAKRNAFNSGCSHPFHNTNARPCFEKVILAAHGTDPFCNLCVSANSYRPLPALPSAQNKPRKMTTIKNKLSNLFNVSSILNSLNIKGISLKNL